MTEKLDPYLQTAKLCNELLPRVNELVGDIAHQLTHSPDPSSALQWFSELLAERAIDVLSFAPGHDFLAAAEFVEDHIAATKERWITWSKVSYPRYLQTKHWQQVRAGALERAGYRCQLCNSTTRLETHHRTYERLWGELPEDLIVLCRACHAKFHDKLP